MRRIFLYIIFISLSSGSVLGQSRNLSKVDSIVSLAISISEEALFEARFDDAKQVLELSYFENLKGYKPTHRILLTVQEIRVNGFMNIFSAQKTNHLKNFERLKVLLPYAKELDNQKALGQYFLTFSNAYRSIGQLDSSSLYQERAISIFSEINAFEEIAKIRASNVSRHHNQLLEEDKKQEIVELIPIYKKEIEYSMIYSKYALAYNTRHLAQIYRRQTFNYEEALRLFKLSLDLRIEIGFIPFIPASYSSLGDVYMKMEQYPEAIEMYTKSSELAEEIGFVRYQLYPNIQIGDYYQENGQADEAFEYYLKALKFATENNYSIGIDQSIEKIKEMNK